MTGQRERAEHTLVLDHDDCNHEPGDAFFCNPRIASATCEAAVGTYCRYGCGHGDHGDFGWEPCRDEECDAIRRETAEDYGVTVDVVPDHPGGDHCTLGHPLQSHDCWAVVWIESSDLQLLINDNDHPGPDEVWRGGPVVIDTWYSDEFTVRYPTADDVVPT